MQAFLLGRDLPVIATPRSILHATPKSPNVEIQMPDIPRHGSRFVFCHCLYIGS